MDKNDIVQVNCGVCKTNADSIILFTESQNLKNIILRYTQKGYFVHHKTSPFYMYLVTSPHYCGFAAIKYTSGCAITKLSFFD